MRVCLGVDTIDYPEGGGHFWAYLNWALGFVSLGCDVVWLEHVGDDESSDVKQARATSVAERLAHYGLADSLAVCATDGSDGVAHGAWAPERAWDADLFVNLRYSTDERVVKRFRRSALVDIDPGLLQLWMRSGEVVVAPHDVYFTTGEHVSGFGADVRWLPTSPCVAVDHWSTDDQGFRFTTVSQWWTEDFIDLDGEIIDNSKRAGFLDFLAIPDRSPWSLELALCLGDDELSREERRELARRGWGVTDANTVASTPWDYQRYIAQSAGEFSCAKPSCMRLQNAWLSDRTLCYLAAGKPAVVQHTGPSSRLPDRCGMLRFRDPDEAVHCLQLVAGEYDRHREAARALAGEFTAHDVAHQLLERAVG